MAIQFLENVLKMFWKWIKIRTYSTWTSNTHNNHVPCSSNWCRRSLAHSLTTHGASPARAPWIPFTSLFAQSFTRSRVDAWLYAELLNFRIRIAPARGRAKEIKTHLRKHHALNVPTYLLITSRWVSTRQPGLLHALIKWFRLLGWYIPTYTYLYTNIIIMKDGSKRSIILF